MTATAVAVASAAASHWHSSAMCHSTAAAVLGGAYPPSAWAFWLADGSGVACRCLLSGVDASAPAVAALALSVIARTAALAFSSASVLLATSVHIAVAVASVAASAAAAVALARAVLAANTLLTTEKASSEKILSQLKSLEDENRRLKDDLGFFEKLAPSLGAEGVTIRALQGDIQADGKIRWQVLLIQAKKNPAEFSGHLEVAFVGVLNGKPWIGAVSGPGGVPVKLLQYGRIEGLYEVPAQVQIKSLTVKLFEGSTLRATQSAKM